MNGLWSTATVVALTAGLSAQNPGQAPATPPNSAVSQERPTFKVQVDLVTNDIIVRDEKGNFIPDLKKEEFEIFEDGVKQRPCSRIAAQAMFAQAPTTLSRPS